MFSFEQMKDISYFLIFFGTFTTVAAIYKISQTGSSSIIDFLLPQKQSNSSDEKSINEKISLDESNSEYDNFDLSVYK